MQLVCDCAGSAVRDERSQSETALPGCLARAASAVLFSTWDQSSLYLCVLSGKQECASQLHARHELFLCGYLYFLWSFPLLVKKVLSNNKKKVVC